MDTQHRTVVVTGAAGNLGRAVASAFAAQGANLVLIDLKREALAAAYGDENSEGKQRLFLATNLLEQEEVNQAVTAAMQRFGRIDVLCNLTGGFRMGDAVHAGGRWRQNHQRGSLRCAKRAGADGAVHGGQKRGHSAHGKYGRRAAHEKHQCELRAAHHH